MLLSDQNRQPFPLSLIDGSYCLILNWRRLSLPLWAYYSGHPWYPRESSPADLKNKLLTLDAGSNPPSTHGQVLEYERRRSSWACWVPC